MIIKRVFLGVIALTLLAAQAVASPRPPAEFFERIDQLVAWIGENSDYPSEVKRYPAIVFLPAEVLNYLYYEGAAGVPYKGQDQVRALYVDGMMFLGEGFRLGEDDYILLHELVHHLQSESGKEFACGAEREREVYELQVRFVEESGRGEVPSPLFLALLKCGLHS